MEGVPTRPSSRRNLCPTQSASSGRIRDLVHYLSGGCVYAAEKSKISRLKVDIHEAVDPAHHLFIRDAKTVLEVQKSLKQVSVSPNTEIIKIETKMGATDEPIEEKTPTAKSGLAILEPPSWMLNKWNVLSRPLSLSPSSSLLRTRLDSTLNGPYIRASKSQIFSMKGGI